MTNQKAFEIVARGLLKQNCKSEIVDSYGEKRCMYRGNNGAKCAVGWLLPNDEYRREFEGKSCTTITYMTKNFDVDFIRRLQETHDFFDVVEWKSELRNICKRFNLIWPEDL